MDDFLEYVDGQVQQPQRAFCLVLGLRVGQAGGVLTHTPTLARQQRARGAHARALGGFSRRRRTLAIVVLGQRGAQRVVVVIMVVVGERERGRTGAGADAGADGPRGEC